MKSKTDKKLFIGSKGFTLVEVLVTILLFSIIVTAIGGIFIQILRTQRHAFLAQQVQENINFVLEAMAREIRVSKVCPETGQCAISSVLDIEHPVNGNIQYNLSGGRIHRVDDGVDTIISSAVANVTRLNFLVSGTENNDDRQPRVTIIVTASGDGAGSASEISAQVTVSQRFLSDQYKK